MTIASRLFALIGKLPPAETHAVKIERDLPVPMGDGVILLADLYAPQEGGPRPTILIRCCYGRRGVFGFMYGRLYAERGFQVVMQSTRGTFGSGGELNPFQDERKDGLATVAWLKQQPWFSGQFVTHGASYLGFVQWAIASEAGPELKALSIQASTADFRDQTYGGGAFSLDTAITWMHLMSNQEKPLGLLRQMFNRRALKRASLHLPLRELDIVAEGKPVSYFQDWLEHSQPGDEYWQKREMQTRIKDITAPIYLMGGWYDIFLPWMLQDFRTLRDAGKHPSLLIGPWAHSSVEMNFTQTMSETLLWFKAHLSDDATQLRTSPVRIFVTGANEWRDLTDWPPPDRKQQNYYLHPSAHLATVLPEPSEPDHYRYDPADPTPALAGPRLTGDALPRDNRIGEARADVLIYTSTVLPQALDVIGPVQVELFVRSSLEHTDFFARLCDVDQQGKSLNVCDALLRVEPGQQPSNSDGSLHLSFDLWPTAHRFRTGHRLRVQISSGAHPRYARNTGSGEPLATATKLLIADQTIYHDPEHPSCIKLSIVEN